MNAKLLVLLIIGILASTSAFAIVSGSLTFSDTTLAKTRKQWNKK